MRVQAFYKGAYTKKEMLFLCCSTGQYGERCSMHYFELMENMLVCCDCGACYDTKLFTIKKFDPHIEDYRK